MKVILETQRLLLRELNVGDAEDLYALNLNPKVVRYTGDKSFADVEEARSLLLNFRQYLDHGYGRWAVIHKTTGSFLGWCGLKYHAEKKETDIGFRFFEMHWNKGFATESAKACIDYGFSTLGLEAIIGRVMRANVPSVRVLEKLGLNFVREFDFDGQPGLIYQIERNTSVV